MLDTLYGKTFLILTIQLALTWASTFLFILWLRQRYYARAAWVGSNQLLSGELDLELDWQAVAPWFWLLLGVDVAVFLLLLFVGQHNLAIGLPLFCLWSLLTGIELALALVAVDENLGGKVLALTAMLTFAAFLAGAYAGIDFSFLGSTLFAGLTLVLLGASTACCFPSPTAGDACWPCSAAPSSSATWCSTSTASPAAPATTGKRPWTWPSACTWTSSTCSSICWTCCIAEAAPAMA
jgi:FtsH-binding integral membrane protein